MTTMLFDINYEKRKNKELFKELETHEILSTDKLQNYSPIYNKFFALNETNYNNINLNHKWFISNIQKSIDEKNCFSCLLKNVDETQTKVKNVFFKMAPLLDPYKYMVGKYNVNDESLLNLPSFHSTTNVHPKIMDVNNSSYVDGFFSFLSSKLLNNNFIHGVDYYGSFLGIKNTFTFNVIDDLDYLIESDFFNKNKNHLFQIQDYSHLMTDNYDAIQKLKPIQIHDDMQNNVLLNDNLFENLFEITEIKELLEETNDNISVLTEMNIDEISKNFSNDHSTTIKTSSSCSSRTSHTSTSSSSKTNEDEDDHDDKADGEDMLDEEDGNNDTNTSKSFTEEECEESDDDVSGGDSSSRSSFCEEETLYASIPKFPIQLIAMEHCQDTFDNLILKSENLSNDEWLSAFMQIIMILITYQKAYSFTHNDLHTSNIMYNTTDKKFLYYCFKKKYYKVPTFGRIFKIIDFGRSIYKFKNVLFCSDSFKNGGDAATQYNTEPYMNNNKPRLDPNYSFDLCRLACSIFDYLIDDMDEIKDLNQLDPFVRIVVEWCIDDNGINVLYKNNGGERYPDFKLYKMIARHVHNHTPVAQLERKEFMNYNIHKNKIKNLDQVMNIDEICANIYLG